MYVNTKNTTDESEALGAAEIDGTTNGFSLELIEQRIRAQLEPLNAQISKLTQLLNQLIQDNSAMTTPTAGPRTHRPQARPSFKREVGTSRAQPDTVIGDTLHPQFLSVVRVVVVQKSFCSIVLASDLTTSISTRTSRTHT